MSKKDKNKDIVFKEKITLEETNINEIKEYNSVDDKKAKILLISILSLTIIDLILYISGSSLGVLYIPIMCIVFILLAIYNTTNSVYISFIDDTLVLFDKKDFSHTIEIKEIKEIREKKSKIVVTMKNDDFFEFKTINKEKVFEKIREGILK